MKMTRNEKRLQALLYLLLRENLTFGQLEKQLEAVEKCFGAGNWPVFSEKTQARYARIITHQILKKKPKPLRKLGDGKIRPLLRPNVGDIVQYLIDGRQGELMMIGETDGCEWGRVKFTEICSGSCRERVTYENLNRDNLIPVIAGDDRKRSNYPVS